MHSTRTRKNNMSDFTSVHNSLTDDIIQAELGEDKSPFHCLETELEEKTQLDHLDGGHSDTPEILSPWQSRGHGNLNALGEAKSAESSPIISRRKNRASRARIRSSGNINHSGDGRSTDDLEHPTLPPRRRLRIYRAGNRTNKWVTREIAALEFLTGVRMRNEEAIRERALHGGNGDEDTFFGGSGLGYNSSWFSPEQYGDSETLLEGTPAATPNGMVQTPGQDKSMAAAVSITSPGVADDDSDSDGGWLDQPHPRGSGRTGVGNAATWRGQSSSTRSVVPGVAAIHSRISGGGSPAPARRLRGREAAHVRVPTMFRNHMHKLPGHGAAVVRQWEQGLTQQERLLEGRMFFSASKSYPLMVSSVLHYKPAEEEAKRLRQKRIDERGAEAFQILKRDWRGHSYAHLLRQPPGAGNGSLQNATERAVDVGVAISAVGGGMVGAGGASCGAASSGVGLEHSDGEGACGGLSGGGVGVNGGADGAVVGRAAEPEGVYQAGFLDDPALKLGKHRHMSLGDQNTGPVVSSVLLFVKPRVLKDELNARFRENHPNLPPSLTLSKIRSIKRQALLGCYKADIEVATVALACVYFERLCLAGVVTKPNRRLTMAACLAIAYKFNEPVLTEGGSKLPALWTFVDQEWLVSKKQVLEAEFGVLVKLSFELHEDPRNVFHHFVLLLKIIDSHASLYLGEDMMRLHQETLETFFHDGSSDDAHGASVGGDGSGVSNDIGGAADSPRAKTLSNTSIIDAEPLPRNARAEGSSPWIGGSGWLQRRPASAGRWLAGFRGSPDVEAASRVVPLPGVGSAQRWSAPGEGHSFLAQARQSLSKETRQRRQRLNKNVRDGASSLARGLSQHRRRGRRRMETE